MPEKGDCKICSNELVKNTVDDMLLANKSVYWIAKNYKLSATTIRRHRDNHLDRSSAIEEDIMFDAVEKETKIKASTKKHNKNPLMKLGSPIDDLGDNLSTLYKHGLNRLFGCYKERNEVLELSWFRELRGMLTIIVKAHEVASSTNTTMSEVADLSIKVLEALSDHPDAREAVATALINKA